jgi:predicted signal transduction protein with EAL and GGDEF domain
MEKIASPTVVVFDIDNFKDVNTTFSHSVGDSVLLAVARRIVRVLPTHDMLARLHGDSFAVIVLSESDPRAIEQMTRELLHTIKGAISVGDRDVFMTASVALRLPPQREARRSRCAAPRRQSTRRSATAATTCSSTSRRSACAAAASISTASCARRSRLATSISSTSRSCGSRTIPSPASRRWCAGSIRCTGASRPTSSSRPAEESGLIVQLGLYVLEHAARELASWQSVLVSTPLPFVSINLSSRELLRHDLINDVKAVLARTGVAPETLKLEITESLVMQNPEYSAKVLAKIRELGAGLALDDFGTGYSASPYLQHFPFDTIKIDKSFVRPNGSPSRAILLRSIVTMAHDLGMEVVAEGAETEAEVMELRRSGCENAQGFVYGRPMTPQMVQQMVRRRLPRGEGS